MITMPIYFERTLFLWHNNEAWAVGYVTEACDLNSSSYRSRSCTQIPCNGQVPLISAFEDILFLYKAGSNWYLVIFRTDIL